MPNPTPAVVPLRRSYYGIETNSGGFYTSYVLPTSPWYCKGVISYVQDPIKIGDTTQRGSFFPEYDGDTYLSLVKVTGKMEQATRYESLPTTLGMWFGPNRTTNLSTTAVALHPGPDIVSVTNGADGGTFEAVSYDYAAAVRFTDVDAPNGITAIGRTFADTATAGKLQVVRVHTIKLGTSIDLYMKLSSATDWSYAASVAIPSNDTDGYVDITLTDPVSTGPGAPHGSLVAADAMIYDGSFAASTPLVSFHTTPSIPSKLEVTVTGGVTNSGSKDIVIVGTDANDDAQTDTLSFTAAGFLSKESTTAFKTIVSITPGAGWTGTALHVTVIAKTVAGYGYYYFLPKYNVDDTLNITAWWGDNAGGWRVPLTVGSKIEFKGELGKELHAAIDILGQNRVAATLPNITDYTQTQTAFPAVYSSKQEAVIYQLFKLYIDNYTNSDNYGTTQVQGKLMNCNFSFDNQRKPRHYADGTSTPGRFSRGQYVVEWAPMFERTTDTTEFDDWQNGTRRRVRLQGGNAAGTKHFTIDIYGTWTTEFVQGEMDNNVTESPKFLPEVDPYTDVPFRLTVQNGLRMAS